MIIYSDLLYEVIASARWSVGWEQGRLLVSLVGGASHREMRERCWEMKEGESPKSEIARIRYHIATEADAMRRGLSGYATVARHAHIHARMAMLEPWCARLVAQYGEQQGMEMFLTLYDQEVQ